MKKEFKHKRERIRRSPRTLSASKRPSRGLLARGTWRCAKLESPRVRHGHAAAHALGGSTTSARPGFRPQRDSRHLRRNLLKTTLPNGVRAISERSPLRLMLAATTARRVHRCRRRHQLLLPVHALVTRCRANSGCAVTTHRPRRQKSVAAEAARGISAARNASRAVKSTFARARDLDSGCRKR